LKSCILEKRHFRDESLIYCTLPVEVIYLDALSLLFRQNRQKRAKMTEQNRTNTGAEIAMFRQNRQKRAKMTEQTTMGIGGSILFQKSFYY